MVSISLGGGFTCHRLSSKMEALDMSMVVGIRANFVIWIGSNSPTIWAPRNLFLKESVLFTSKCVVCGLNGFVTKFVC